MNNPFAAKAPVLSYAEGPRLQRTVQVLSQEDRNRFITCYNAHLRAPCIRSVQRRGPFLYITLIEDNGESVAIYDFGGATPAQSCLTALTDCFRTQRVSVPVLMPAAVDSPKEKG